MMRKLERDEIQDRIPAYVLGTLPDDERAQIEAAIEADRELADEVEFVRLARSALAPHGAPTPDVDRIVAALPPPGLRPARKVARWRIAAAIATLAVGGASLTIVQQTMRGGSPADSLAIVGESTVAQNGAELSITFGYGLGDLTADELETLIQELRESNGLPAEEPQVRPIIPTPEEM